MSNQSIEKQIQSAGKTAPRVTPEDIENEIVREFYFLAGDGIYGAAHKAGDHSIQEFPESLDLTTICVLTLRNGFTVIGVSAGGSPENFDKAIGQRIAREDAIEEIWPLLGFRLADKLMVSEVTRKPAQSSGARALDVDYPSYDGGSVRAFKIGKIFQGTVPGANDWRLMPADEGLPPFHVSHEWYCFNKPICGGYLVFDKYGQTKFVDTEAFESQGFAK